MTEPARMDIVGSVNHRRVTVIALASVILGWWLGAVTSSLPDSRRTSAAPSRSTAPAEEPRGEAPHSPPSRGSSPPAGSLNPQAFPSLSGLLALLGRIPSLSSDQCAEVLDEILSLTGGKRELALRALGDHWASIDPEGALLVVRGTVDPEDPRWILAERAARAIARSDPDLLLEFIHTSDSPVARMTLAWIILPEIAEADPGMAARFLAEAPAWLRWDKLCTELAHRMALRSPAEALAWTESIPSLAVRSQSIARVWQTWAERDPAGAAAAFGAAAVPGPGRLAQAIGRSWSGLDPFAARTWIESLSDPTLQREAWTDFHLPVDQLGPDGAMDFIQSTMSEAARERMAERVAGDLGRKDPRAALLWAEQLPEGKVRSSALRSVLSDWSSTDPASAAAYASTLPEESWRADILHRAIDRWSVVDPDAALAWCQSLPPGSERDRVLAAAIENLSEIAPDGASGWLALLSDERSRTRAVSQVAAHWARHDPLAAASWAATRPSGEQPAVFHSLVRGWAFSEPEAAGSWINALPPGRPRDAAIEAYVSVIDGMDAGMATQWALAIDEPGMRDRAAFEMFQRWRHDDPSAADAWLGSTEIPEALKTRIAASLTPSGAHAE